MAVSPSGKTVFVTGNSDRASNASGYATIAYNAATGTQLWVARYNGPKNSGQANSVTVSPSGSTVYVTGYTDTTDYVDFATVAYSAATGAQLWVKLYHGSARGGDNEAFSLGVSPSGNTVFVTGGYEGTKTEKRKVGGSTPPLTTPSEQLKHPVHDRGRGVLESGGLSFGLLCRPRGSCSAGPRCRGAAVLSRGRSV